MRRPRTPRQRARRPFAPVGWPLGKRLGSVLLFVLLTGCRDKKQEQEALPLPAALTVRPCKSAPEVVDGLPGRIASFCIDGMVDVRRYGSGNSSPLEAVCGQLFHGECEHYRSYGLEGVKTLRYVESSGAPHFVNLTLARFRSSAGAFGFFTQRVLGEADPSRLPAKSIELSGRGALGVGTATLWRGKQVAELTYVSDDQTPDEVARRADAVLVPLARVLSRALTGPTLPPLDVRLLESRAPLPLGVTRHTDGALGVVGSGDFAVAHFSEDEQSRTEQRGAPGSGTQGARDSAYRMMVAVRPDEDGAAGVVRLLRRQLPNHSLKHQPIIQLRVESQDRSPETWFASRLAGIVLLVGPARNRPSRAKTKEDRDAEAEAWRGVAVQLLLDFRQQVTAIVREE